MEDTVWFNIGLITLTIILKRFWVYVFGISMAELAQIAEPFTWFFFE